MADSIEQKLVTRALAVCAAINGTGSYQTTLGSTIVSGTSGQSLADSRPNWEQDELPALSIVQLPVDPEDRDDEARQVLRKAGFRFLGFLERGTDAATARKFLSDIMRAIRAAGDRWIVSSTPLAQHTEEAGHRIEYAEGTYEITGVAVDINIFYVASYLDMDA